MSPYFFNAGLFSTGQMLDTLGAFYAKALLAARDAGRIEFDMLFGPAYKGIPLVSTVAMNLARMGCDCPYAFNRKEAKDHGEGGTVIGAPLKGRVVIIDDVISAGTSVRESVALITANGATPAGVLIALDRMEKGGDAVNLTATSAAQDVEKTFNMPVVSIANLKDLLSFMYTGEEVPPQNRKGALRRYDEIVRKGDPVALIGLRLMHLDGDAGQPDRERTAVYLLEAARTAAGVKGASRDDLSAAFLYLSLYKMTLAGGKPSAEAVALERELERRLTPEERAEGLRKAEKMLKERDRRAS